MFKSIIKMIGNSNDRSLKKIQPIVDKINSLEEKISSYSVEELKNQTTIFKERLKNGDTLDSLLPEAFAVLREAAYRAFNQRAYDVQLIGGIVLHQGNISEMRTGEGKTLTAAFPSYLNALTGKGVHVITVNDYLAQRDSEKMEKLFSLLDITVGCNIANMLKTEKDLAYKCDITYGTGNEFGFDYLRDNMALTIDGTTQRGLNYALIDEVDSVLIDEARTPLIISDKDEDSKDLYFVMRDIPLSLKEGKEVKSIVGNSEEGDYYIDQKLKNVFLTDQGYEKSEKELVKLGVINENDSLYDISNTHILSALLATIKAHTVFHKDKDYIVSEDDKVKIIDEHTGRIMEGRRWNDGLHQAVEAKEGVYINAETITLATITLQNYFNLYNKLSGMTGTADSEAYEFKEVYNLNTIVIPTNKPIQRIDFNDKIYISKRAKINAVLDEIKKVHKEGRPILIGTNSIENNELFSQILTENNLKHNLLNAKNHLKEAEIVAQSGKKGAITVATNMAGRGTDIILGGNIEHEIEKINSSEILSEETKKEKIEELKKQWILEHDEVLSLGGLHVIGTERHESRRIDNQFRGRSGRQGDKGSSVFFTSFDDDLLKPYAERIKAPFKAMKFKESDVLEGKLLTRQVASAQEKMEKMHYEIRKNLIDYDSVVSLQRAAIYKHRNELMRDMDQKSMEEEMDILIKSSIMRKINAYISPDVIYELWDIKGLIDDISESYDILLPLSIPEKIETNSKNDSFDNVKINDFMLNFELPLDKFVYGENYSEEEIQNKIFNFIVSFLKIKLNDADQESLFLYKKSILLQIIDRVWREHLNDLNYLKNGIHLRGYAQKDPKQEYKNEALKMFLRIRPAIEDDFTNEIFKLKIQTVDEMNDRSRELNKQIEDLKS